MGDGTPAHVMQGGNNRQACFFADYDHLFFLDCLAKNTKRFQCALHAYVLMTNHFHLLLTSEFGDLALVPIWDYTAPCG